MPLPLLFAHDMRVADARRVAETGQDALVRDAGTAVALEAQRLLGGCYGRRVLVVVGPGLNGADGRVAAAWLTQRGAWVDVVDVSRQPAAVRGYDLYVDAAFGLGCSRPYVAPSVMGPTKVLAVDLPSGVDADTGDVLGAPARADVTLALGAFKYAHVNGGAVNYVGERRFAGLGVVAHALDGLVVDDDLDGFVRFDPRDHKWKHALAILAGSATMGGAAVLACEGALAGGASMVRLTSRLDGARPVAPLPLEVVYDASSRIDARVHAVVAGPGLGADATAWLAPRLRDVSVPVVVDADGLTDALIRARPASVPWVLTPHDGEFARLTGAPLGHDRVGAARQLARDTGCVVLLKGPLTIVADPSGALRVVTSGTSALASAGTGDVLAGLIGAAISRGHDPFTAAALSAFVHGRAGARLGPYATSSRLAGAVRDVIAGTPTRGWR
ncbi:MAG: NAD(P)H-hydrate dehydratase [Acidobacteriota bacterium]|nr:NAD(P)H-hydrate dehydratase [Acidobacteriota bacterium]MDE3043558.1 NAD(P)H-hydrate dehydratase [Acidobacteriota bacterium]MDE3106907.1 NAD(P)H-hydrate dehydratase [Acidobacteriota bacterium]MDE3222564.1 NAD(P)H-hydrate dehydratase [Acidobacteriota bacterium]